MTNSLISEKPSKLHFQPQINNKGFTNEHIQDKSASDLEVAVRELLQNSLDARSDRISMRIVDIPVYDIPGIEEYRAAFASACEVRESSLATSAVEKRIAEQIGGILTNETVSVLLCIDNGSGITAEDMKAVLWSGNTTKAKDGGAGGSFGVGHCSSFKLSNLRYVLYATRNRDNSGNLVELMAGSAVLAEHKTDGKTRSPEGFYVAELMDRDDGQKATYSHPDGQLAHWLNEFTKEDLIPAGATGTIVTIFGFTSEAGIVDKICKAAAKNFYIAFTEGKLSLNVKNGTETDKITNNTIAEHMRQLQSNKASPKKGLLRGSWAASQYRTFTSRDKIIDNENAVVKLRKWKQEEYGSSAARDIAICRNGMWIARNEAPNLLPRNFSETQPFQCVISIKAGSELDQLIKAAEGPEHIGLAYLNEMPAEDSNRLQKLLGEFAEKIREAAGKIADSEEYLLPDFAMLSGGKDENAEPLPDKQRPTPSYRNDFPPEPEPGPKPTPKPFVDKPFTNNLVVSMLPILDGGIVHKLFCLIEIDHEVDIPDNLGIRVGHNSGSDASCDKWLKTLYLKIQSADLESGGQNIGKDESDESLIFVNASHRMRLRIALQNPIATAEANTLKLEAINRIYKEESIQ